MAKRIVTKIGDVFCVVVDNEYKVYFQYIANDVSELNSSTIRVFQKRYSIDDVLDYDKIVNDNTLFYAHTVLSVGIRLGCWEKVGKNSNIGHPENIVFRMCNDFGPGMPSKSHRWYIWKINEPYIFIGELTDEYRKAEIGMVFPCSEIVHKIKYGEYITKYPD